MTSPKIHRDADCRACDVDSVYLIGVRSRDGHWAVVKLCKDHGQAVWECRPDPRLGRSERQRQHLGPKAFERLTPSERRDKEWERLRDRLCDPQRTDFVWERLSKRRPPSQDLERLDREQQRDYTERDR